ncbi:MAG: hypothetical protein ACHQ50_11435 [Fimbriimonadales bacterium]
MAVIGANRNVTAPKWTQPWALYTAVAIVAACILWAAAVTKASVDLKTSFNGQMAQADTNYQRQLAYSRTLGMRQTADAVAASIRPLMTLKDQVPEITDRTLQSVVAGLVEQGNYSLIAVVDDRGRVLASSDLALIGKPMPPNPRSNSVSAPIGDVPQLGSVVLAPR